MLSFILDSLSKANDKQLGLKTSRVKVPAKASCGQTGPFPSRNPALFQFDQLELKCHGVNSGEATTTTTPTKQTNKQTEKKNRNKLKQDPNVKISKQLCSNCDSQVEEIGKKRPIDNQTQEHTAAVYVYAQDL